MTVSHSSPRARRRTGDSRNYINLPRQEGAFDEPSDPLVSVSVVAGLVIISGWVTLTADIQPWVRLVGVAVGLIVAVGAPGLLAWRHHLDAAPVLAVPVVLSAAQNLLLLPIAPVSSREHIGVLLSINLLAAALLTAVAGWGERKRLLRAWGTWPTCGLAGLAVLVLVGAYALASFAMLEVPRTAILASTRNLLSVPAFLLLGILASRAASVTRYCGCLVVLCWGVVLFGLFERFHPTFWQDVRIGDLWEKKGILVETTGLPTNFVSSEQIDGQRIRRMASSFADPVNLGAFLFVAFVAAWYLRRHLSAAVALVGCVLAISKGALVGLLAFCLVAAWFYLPRRAQVAVAAVCGLASAGFMVYSSRSSTGSVFAHIGGLLAAFRELPQAPLGHGVGQSGNLADVFSQDGAALPSTVIESGLGAIVGQMGFPGLLAFGALLAVVALNMRDIQDRRSAVLGWSVLLAFVGNAVFNEVALSPNSSAAYFTILGLLVGRTTGPARRRPAFRPDPSASRRRRAATAAAITVTGLVASCALTWPFASRYEATLDATVVREQFVWNINEQGEPVHQWRSLGREPQRLERSRLYATVATYPWVVAEAAWAAGLISGSEVLARAEVKPVPGPGGLRFTAVHDDPGTAARIASEWAWATARAVTRHETHTRPPPESRLSASMQTGPVEVAEPPPSALTVARHAVLGLGTGLGLALAWWLTAPSGRRDGKAIRPLRG